MLSLSEEAYMHHLDENNNGFDAIFCFFIILIMVLIFLTFFYTTVSLVEIYRFFPKGIINYNLTSYIKYGKME